MRKNMHLQTNKHIAAELAKKTAKQMSNFCLHLFSILFATQFVKVLEKSLSKDEKKVITANRLKSLQTLEENMWPQEMLQVLKL